MSGTFTYRFGHCTHSDYWQSYGQIEEYEIHLWNFLTDAIKSWYEVKAQQLMFDSESLIKKKCEFMLSQSEIKAFEKLKYLVFLQVNMALT